MKTTKLTVYILLYENVSHDNNMLVDALPQILCLLQCLISFPPYQFKCHGFVLMSPLLPACPLLNVPFILISTMFSPLPTYSKKQCLGPVVIVCVCVCVALLNVCSNVFHFDLYVSLPVFFFLFLICRVHATRLGILQCSFAM